MQQVVTEARAAGAQVVVVLSHNGMDVDLKLASHITGIDAILGGHTHDGVPQPVKVKECRRHHPGEQRRLQRQVPRRARFRRQGRQGADFRYTLLPVFSNLIAPDAQMSALIDKVRAPYKEKLEEKLAVSEGLLYRRGNFNGSWDQLILDALMEVKDADIAFSPGFRWGTSLLPGQAITFEHLIGPDRDHLSNIDTHRNERPADQDHPRRCLRQPVQSRPLLPARRGHGARWRSELHLCAPTPRSATAFWKCAWAISCSTPPRNTRWQAGHRWPKAYKASQSGTWWRAGCATRRPSPHASSTTPRLVGVAGKPRAGLIA